MKDKFLKYYSGIKREGADKLLEWIKGKDSDFFTAPASSKYHLACEGGLCEHSVNVYEKLKALAQLQFGKDYSGKFTEESLLIAGLLHDICKINFYEVDYRNVKVGNVWEKQPYYKVDEKVPFGHGEKSVYIVQSFMKITREEAMAINWHMGGFDTRVQGGSYQMGEAYKMYPLAVLLQMADLGATYLDENHSL